MIGLAAIQSRASDLDDFLSMNAITFPVAFDQDNTANGYSMLSASAPYPIHVLVGADGVIRYMAREYDPIRLRAEIEAALAE